MMPSESGVVLFTICLFLSIPDQGDIFFMRNLLRPIQHARFDSIKYDIKKIEEVVYDISLRSLTTDTSSSAAIPKANDGSA